MTAESVTMIPRITTPYCPTAESAFKIVRAFGQVLLQQTNAVFAITIQATTISATLTAPEFH
jgi:hypothetical protein